MYEMKLDEPLMKIYIIIGTSMAVIIQRISVDIRASRLEARASLTGIGKGAVPPTLSPTVGRY
jgi:hypothetical protein